MLERARHREHLLVLVRQPVQVAPDFAAVDLLGLHLVAHGAQRGDGAHGHGRRAYRACRPGCAGRRTRASRPRRICARSAITTGLLRVLDLGAGEAELDLAGVLADVGRFALLEEAHLLHLLVGVIAVDAGARAAGAVGHHHAGEPPVLSAEAFGDAVVGHDLDIVLVRGDAQMRGARERRFGRDAVGNEKVRGGFMKLH